MRNLEGAHDVVCPELFSASLVGVGVCTPSILLCSFRMSTHRRYPPAAGVGPGTINNGVPAKGNSMKFDAPPRPAKAKVSSRKPNAAADSAGAPGGGGSSSSSSRNVTNMKGIAGNKADDGIVPHVVRVTFLGVAGLLAKSSHIDKKSQASNTDEQATQTSEKSIPSASASGHPSLLFHLPSNLRVVASVSRSQAARGIPSGMSKCLFSINNDKQKPPAIERLCTPDDHSIGLDVFGQNPNRTSSNTPEKDAKGRNKFTSGSCLDPAPPSQLSHVRSLNKGRNGGTGSIASESATNPSSKNVRTPSTAGTSTGDMSKSVGPGSVTLEDQPERLVAVWEKALKNTAAAATTTKTSTNHKFVNLTNSLAFEAELRPSSLMLNVSKNVPPSPSTAHAPKSFCITVGLVPDYDALEGVKVDEEQKPSSTPPFAIPVGFAARWSGRCPQGLITRTASVGRSGWSVRHPFPADSQLLY
ncbi:hypothetical protein ACHAXH_000705 [Discostella pseudostelligera]